MRAFDVFCRAGACRRAALFEARSAGKRRPYTRRVRAAFTLLEVVVAVGIFAIGMVAVFGLFAPVAKSVGDSADAEAATRVADLLGHKLQTQGFESVAKLLKVSAGKTHQLTDADAKTNYNIATDAQLMFASRDGTKIGTYADPFDRSQPRAAEHARQRFFWIG